MGKIIEMAGAGISEEEVEALIDASEAKTQEKIDLITTNLPKPGTASPLVAGESKAGESDKFAREDHVHPLQQDIPGNAETANRLSKTIKINNINFDGSQDIEIPAATLNGLSKVAMSGEYADLLNKPLALSKFSNDTNFITNTVNDLLNYYTKDAINGILADLPKLNILVISDFPSSPDTSTIYLKPKSGAKEKNVYEEYLYINNDWEKIGDTEVDLSNYYTKTEVDNKLGSKANSSDLTAHINDTVVHVNANEKSKWDAKSDFSGNYNDLSNKPTALSAFQNDTNFITSSAIPANVSQFTNDSSYTKPIKASNESDAITKSKSDAVNIYYWV